MCPPHLSPSFPGVGSTCPGVECHERPDRYLRPRRRRPRAPSECARQQHRPREVYRPPRHRGSPCPTPVPSHPSGSRGRNGSGYRRVPWRDSPTTPGRPGRVSGSSVTAGQVGSGVLVDGNDRTVSGGKDVLVHTSVGCGLAKTPVGPLSSVHDGPRDRLPTRGRPLYRGVRLSVSHLRRTPGSHGQRRTTRPCTVPHRGRRRRVRNQ